MSLPDIKKLYALSAGKCNICRKGLFEDSVHIGEMAHVIARKKKGPRGNETIAGDRDGYSNLILLCANHHVEVDQNPNGYPVHELHRLKAQHERWVADALMPLPGRDDDVQSLRYLMQFVPYTQLASAVYHLPVRFDSEIFSPCDMMTPFRIDRPHGYPFNDPDLQRHFSKYIDSAEVLSKLLNGQTNFKANYLQEVPANSERLYGRINSAGLTFEERRILIEKVSSAKDQFEKAYYSLTNFLRASYPEVALDSYI